MRSTATRDRKRKRRSQSPEIDDAVLDPSLRRPKPQQVIPAPTSSTEAVAGAIPVLLSPNQHTLQVNFIELGRTLTIDFGGLKLEAIYNMTTRNFFSHLGIAVTFLQGHPLFNLDDIHGSNCAKLHTWTVQNMPGRKQDHIADPRQNSTGRGLFYPFSLAKGMRPKSADLCPGQESRPAWYSDDDRCLSCNTGDRDVRPCRAGPIKKGKCVTCQGYATHNKALACYWANPLCFISTKDVAKVFEGGRYASRERE